MRKTAKLTHILIIGLFALTASAMAQDAAKEPDPLFSKALKYFYSNKLQMAELLFQETLKKDPENHQAYSYLGDIFLNKKQYDGALQLYLRAIDISPNNAQDFFRIGQIYYYKKIGNLAIENFSKAVQLDTKVKYAYYHIGLTHLMVLRDKQNTITSWEKYLAMAPEDPQYEKIRRVIELLKDPDFVIPPVGSDISIEEALHLGGKALDTVKRESTDRKAGHEKKKTKTKFEDIYKDDDL